MEYLVILCLCICLYVFFFSMRNMFGKCVWIFSLKHVSLHGMLALSLFSCLIEHGCAACLLHHGIAQRQSNIGKFFNWPAQPQLILHFLVVWPHLLKTYISACGQLIWPLLGDLIGSQVSEEKNHTRPNVLLFCRTRALSPWICRPSLRHPRASHPPPPLPHRSLPWSWGPGPWSTAPLPASEDRHPDSAP